MYNCRNQQALNKRYNDDLFKWMQWSCSTLFQTNPSWMLLINILSRQISRLMWVKQCHKPSPSHHHFYRWYGYHSQSWVVYGIVLPIGKAMWINSKGMLWWLPKNRGTPKSSILVRCSIINHPFWGTPIPGTPHMCLRCNQSGLQMVPFQSWLTCRKSQCLVISPWLILWSNNAMEHVENLWIHVA